MAKYIDRLNAARDASFSIGERLGHQRTIDNYQIAMARYEKLNLVITFSERYPEVREITYHGRKK